MTDHPPDLKEDIVTEIEDEVTEPPLFKVLIHNDDYTTKDFVVKILVAVFNKSLEEATSLMWVVHKNGRGCVGFILSRLPRPRSASSPPQPVKTASHSKRPWSRSSPPPLTRPAPPVSTT